MRARAASSATFRAGPAQLAALLADDQVRLGGASASNFVSDRLVSTGTAEVWVADAGELDGLVQHWGLLYSRRKRDCQMRLREESGPARRWGDDAYRLIVAADLLNGPDSRSRTAGVELLVSVARTEVAKR